MDKLYENPLSAIADAPQNPNQIDDRGPANPKREVAIWRKFPSPGPCIKCNQAIGPQEAFTESTTMRGLLHISCGQLTNEDIAEIRRRTREAQQKSKVWMRRDSVFGYPPKDAA